MPLSVHGADELEAQRRDCPLSPVVGDSKPASAKNKHDLKILPIYEW